MNERSLVLIEKLSRQGVRLLSNGDRLRVQAPRGVVGPGILEELRKHKAAILAALRSDSATVQGGRTSFPPSALAKLLNGICEGLPIIPTEIMDAMSPEDIKDWQAGHIPSEALVAFANSLATSQAIDQGQRPRHYTQQATCTHCGPIWLWIGGKVQGCPWCRNRLSEKPIPRPRPVQCIGCQHFQRRDHPRLGHCLRGAQRDIGGLWDADRRACEYWLPKP